MNTERRIAALERAPLRLSPQDMTLEELLEHVVRLVGEHDAAAAQRLRECAPRDALDCAREVLGALARA